MGLALGENHGFEDIFAGVVEVFGLHHLILRGLFFSVDFNFLKFDAFFPHLDPNILIS
jgi:hypothetical protein